MQPIINTLLDPVVNFGKATVSTGYSNLDTVILLANGHGSKLPNPYTDGPFNIIWYDSSTYGDPSDDPNVEIVRCTVRNGDILTVTRGQEGTLASNKNTLTNVYNMILSATKKTITDIKTEYESGVSTHSALSTGVHGVGISTVESITGSQAKVDTHATSTTTHGVIGTVVGTTNSQALTNKTVTDSTNNVTARSLKSATTTIDVSSSAAPSTGQVLTATGSTAATWQTPSGSLGMTTQSSPSRSIGTVYQNTTGKPLIVAITIDITSSQYCSYCDSNTNPVTQVAKCRASATADSTMTFIVLPNYYYKVTKLSGSTGTLSSWIEWS